MNTETTPAQTMPRLPGARPRSIPGIAAGAQRHGLELPRTSWSRATLEVALFLSTVAACIALAVATFGWLSKVDAVSYIPPYSIDAAISAAERAR